jgi:hypothetical protein
MNKTYMIYQGRYLITLLLAGVILLFSGNTVASQQYDQSTLVSSSVPDTEPPRILLVIMVDDSSTMNLPGLNSIATSGFRTVPKDVTDNTNERWKFVAKLASILNSDPISSHELAVMSFDTDINGWYTDVDRDGDPFITLGQMSDDQAQFDSFMSLIASPPLGDFPGDTFDAVSEAKRVIDAWMLENSNDINSKPVFLLITDDVPIASFVDSPFSADLINWLGYHNRFVNTLQEMTQSLSSTTNYCSHGNGGSLFITLAMGAANWINDVNRDGFIVSRTERINTSGEGDYFQAIARELNSFKRDGSTPLVYSIDPLLENTIQTREDFKATLNALYDELRCTVTEGVSSTSINNQQEYTVYISPFNDRVVLVFNEPSSANINIFPPNSTEPLPPDLFFKHSPENHSHQVISLLRSSVRNAGLPWAGDWRLNVQNGSENSLDVIRQVNLQNISWINDPPYQKGASQLTIKITVDDIPIQDVRAIPFDVTGIMTNLANTTQQIPVQLDANVDSFTINISDFEGRYELSLALSIPDTLIPTATSWRQIDLMTNQDLPSIESVTVDPKLIIESPNDLTIDDLACDEKFPVRARIILDGEVDESVNTYTDIGIYYKPSESIDFGLDPITQLSWDLGDFFSGTVACNQLVAGADQELDIRAHLPNEDVPLTEKITFDYYPTQTPNPTPLPTVTPLPRITEPPADDPVQATVDSIANDLLTQIVIVAFTLYVLIRMLLGGYRFYTSNYLRLASWLIKTGNTVPKPLAERPYLPRRSVSFTHTLRHATVDRTEVDDTTLLFVDDETVQVKDGIVDTYEFELRYDAGQFVINFKSQRGDYISIGGDRVKPSDRDIILHQSRVEIVIHLPDEEIYDKIILINTRPLSD